MQKSPKKNTSWVSWLCPELEGTSLWLAIFEILKLKPQDLKGQSHLAHSQIFKENHGSRIPDIRFTARFLKPIYIYVYYDYYDYYYSYYYYYYYNYIIHILYYIYYILYFILFYFIIYILLYMIILYCQVLNFDPWLNHHQTSEVSGLFVELE